MSILFGYNGRNNQPPLRCSVPYRSTATIRSVESPTQGLLQLAAGIRERIEVLGLTTLEIGDRGGPQRGALREILNARRTPRRSTLSSIDQVLGWPAGTAQDILDQRRPAPDPGEWLEGPAENRLGLVRSRLVHQRKEHLRLADAHNAYAEELTALVDLIDEERAGNG